MSMKINSEKKSIFNLAKHGDLAALKKLIENGANANAKNNDGTTPLHLAANNDHLDIVALLIANGADVNAKDDGGTTPLHLAANNDHLDMVDRLIEHGADVNAMNNDGSTPLHWAVYSGHLDITETLIENGADVNAVNNRGKTPLYLAVNNGDLHIVNKLKNNGAEMNPKNNDSNSSVHRVDHNNHFTVKPFPIRNSTENNISKKLEINMDNNTSLLSANSSNQGACHEATAFINTGVGGGIVVASAFLLFYALQRIPVVSAVTRNVTKDVRNGVSSVTSFIGSFFRNNHDRRPSVVTPMESVVTVSGCNKL